MFSSLKYDELDAFIITRQNINKPEFTAKCKIPKKGTIREAEQGKKNKIRIAFDCRMLKNVLVDNMPFNINAINSDVVGSGVDQLYIVNVSIGQANEDRVFPSHLLSEEYWVRWAINLLGLEDMNVMSTITEQQKVKADHLLKILQDRFQQHLVARIRNKTKRDICIRQPCC